MFTQGNDNNLLVKRLIKKNKVVINTKKTAIKLLAFVTLSMASFMSIAQTEVPKTVTVYNCATQIGKNTIADFQAETGIKVNYDVYDSNETLETKLIVGNTVFDVVSPLDSFLARQIESELYLPLDKNKLPNYKNLDPALMKTMEMHDPENKYAIPYVFMTTGIGYNVAEVKNA